jgi:tetratricopeptide (TPR) repeat protein
MQNHQLPPDVERLWNAKMYREAFYRLDHYRSESDDDFLRHQAALCLGSATEFRIYVADRLQIVPPLECLECMVAELDQAITIDDSIAYLHWNLAVIASRYEGNNNAAKEFLAQAMARDLKHPMVPVLQDRIDTQAEPVRPQDTPDYRLREILFRLVDVTADKTLPDKTFKLGDDYTHWSLEDYIDQARGLFSDAAEDALEVALTEFFSDWAGLQDDGVITADALDYGLEFVFRVCELKPDLEATKNALSRLIDFLSRFSMAVTGHAEPTADDLSKGKRIARRGIKILDSTKVAIDPDTEADLWLALGQCSGRPQGLQLADALKGYTRALELKREAHNVEDIDRLEDLLARMLDYAIQQVIGLQVGIGAAGKVYEEIEAAYQAARVLVDEASQLHVGIQYQYFLSSISRPDDALEVLESLLNLGSVDEAARFDLLYEKAARLTEARKSAKAVAILEQLEPEIDSKSRHVQCVYWNCYSNAMRELNKLDKGLKYIDKAIAVKPEKKNNEVDQLNPMLHTNRANILLQMGRADEAEAELKLANDK